MTICAAAISSNNPGTGPHIITVSDTMVSGAIISADSTTLKIEPFHKDWMAMMAADDLTQCIPIIDKAAKYFTGRANTLATARAIFKRAFSQHLIEMQEDAALSRYGMTMKEFLRTGKKKLSEKMYESIHQKIDETKVGCEFIVAGFDSLERPHIFHVTEEGKDGVYDRPGSTLSLCTRMRRCANRRLPSCAIHHPTRVWAFTKLSPLLTISSSR